MNPDNIIMEKISAREFLGLWIFLTNDARNSHRIKKEVTIHRKRII
jgi:hypothetical protein